MKIIDSTRADYFRFADKPFVRFIRIFNWALNLRLKRAGLWVSKAPEPLCLFLNDNNDETSQGGMRAPFSTQGYSDLFVDCDLPLSHAICRRAFTDQVSWQAGQAFMICPATHFQGQLPCHWIWTRDPNNHFYFYVNKE
jgi:hypothetical protein